MELPGFDQVTLADVTAEVSLDQLTPSARTTSPEMDTSLIYHHTSGLQRISDTPMYRTEATLRHANALQKTADNPFPAAGLNQRMLEKYGLSDSNSALVKTVEGNSEIHLTIRLDNRVPDGCVYIPTGHVETAPLGVRTSVSLEKA